MNRALASIGVAALAAGCQGNLDIQQSTQTATVNDAVSAIEIDVDSGSVDLRPREDGRDAVALRVTASWTTRQPTYDATIDGDTLVVTGRCRHQRACSTDFVIRVPPDLPSTVHTGAGDVTVIDMAADADLSTDAGGIEATRVQGQLTVDDAAGDVLITDGHGDVEANTDAGTIEVHGRVADTMDLTNGAGAILGYHLHAADVTAHSDAGGVDLTLDEAFDRVDASSNAGAVSVRVPAGAYRLVLDTGIGSITVGDGITDDPHASSTVRVRSDVGSIQVLGH